MSNAWVNEVMQCNGMGYAWVNEVMQCNGMGYAWVNEGMQCNGMGYACVNEGTRMSQSQEMYNVCQFCKIAQAFLNNSCACILATGCPCMK